MPEKPSQYFEFGPFRLDSSERILWKGHDRITLTPKAFETLMVLVERGGRLVEKEELMKTVWPDSFVEEANLTNNIWALRKALAYMDDGEGYIETVPKRGYRFKAEVRRVQGFSDTVVLERHTRATVVTEERERIVESSWVSRLVIAVAVCLVVVLGVFLVLSRPWRSGEKDNIVSAAAAPKSIAVLPVKSIGGESKEEYLSLGLADALITRLGNVKQIIVRPTSAIRRYEDTKSDPVTIGRQQNVDAVLDGSFQRSGDRIRLTVQLIRVSDGATIWSSQFDEKFDNILSVQDTISERVACDLVTRICGESAAQAIKQNKINFAAYELYLKGRYFWNKRTVDGFQKAADSYRQSLDVEPNYGRAYAGLGDAYYFLSGYERADGETYKRAKSALQRALELDSSLSEPHATLGLMAMNNESNWAESERQFQKAIELNPNYATAHQWYGEFLAYMGRFDEAIRELTKARELDPLSLIINTDLAKVHVIARRYDEAIKLFLSALELDPNFDEAHALLSLTYSLTGRHQHAIAEINKVQQLSSSPGYLSYLAYIYGKAGERKKAQDVYEQLQNISKSSYVSPYWWAYVYLGQDDKEQTLKQLEKAIEEKALGGVVTLKVNPFYDGLRSDPRYQGLLSRAGF